MLITQLEGRVSGKLFSSLFIFKPRNLTFSPYRKLLFFLNAFPAVLISPAGVPCLALIVNTSGAMKQQRSQRCDTTICKENLREWSSDNGEEMIDSKSIQESKILTWVWSCQEAFKELMWLYSSIYSTDASRGFSLYQKFSADKRQSTCSHEAYIVPGRIR